MSYTPFEREMLKKADRTNDLLELLVLAHQPMKVMTGAVSTGPADATKLDQLTPLPGGAQIGGITEQALAAAGILPMVRRPGSGQPETPEQRAERFAARAKEVGLPEEKVAEVSGRIALDLDNLTRPVTAEEVQGNIEGLVDELVDAELRDPTPAKKAPAKRAARPAQ